MSCQYCIVSCKYVNIVLHLALLHCILTLLKLYCKILNCMSHLIFPAHLSILFTWLAPNYLAVLVPGYVVISGGCDIAPILSSHQHSPGRDFCHTVLLSQISALMFKGTSPPSARVAAMKFMQKLQNRTSLKFFWNTLEIFYKIFLRYARHLFWPF